MMNPTGFIAVSPVGKIPDRLLNIIARAVEKNFSFHTRIAPILEDISFAFDPERHQYNSTKILEKLAEKSSGEYVKVIAVTREDLFIPILTHVYGEAQLGGKACIVSTARLESILDTEEKGCNRVMKEALHELGHTFHLTHCRDESCLMHYCRKVYDVDKKFFRFCRYCSIFLSDGLKDIGSQKV
mgnify:CR=1 FL=1